jgi:hypothetical protein
MVSAERDSLIFIGVQGKNCVQYCNFNVEQINSIVHLYYVEKWRIQKRCQLCFLTEGS